jgi:SAM-dependent methyltransferase
LAQSLPDLDGRPAVVDVGCAYGNHLFMLNAMLGKPQNVAMVGVDLFDGAVRRANAFAAAIPGFSNCSFQVADVVAGLPFESGSFDAINCCDVLEHLVSPENALRELARIAKPNATLVISTPLRGGLFKRLAGFGNRAARGRLYRAYYSGKATELDAEGKPMMKTAAGHDHVSEMTLTDLEDVCRRTGFSVEQIELMPVMSGSRWFDRHEVLLAGILLLEAVHEKLQRPSWAHSIMFRLRKS